MTAEPKFTPGPWHSEPDGMGDITIASSQDPLAIAAVVNGSFMAMGGHAAEHEANALLIAAAPDLFHALVETLEIAARNEDGEYAMRARAALSKALGVQS